MSIHFHKLVVKEIRRETPECVSVLFDVPEEIKKDFAFKQGQSLTMRTFLMMKKYENIFDLRLAAGQ
jgi:ring-1,2-phenylacetyl-CoA epoxidase subunit PaaE